MENNISFWQKYDWRDVAFWGSLATALIWALAKTFGFLHSPPLVESIPVYTLIFAAFAAFRKIESSLIKLEYDNSAIKECLSKLEQEVFYS